MKKLFLFLLITFTMMISAAPLFAASGTASHVIWEIVTPLILLVVTPLLVRLFKKIGIDITNDALDPILIKIIELIVSVEEDAKATRGEDKKRLVVEMAYSKLTPKELKTVTQKYGSLSAAVQAAYEMSSTAIK